MVMLEHRCPISGGVSCIKMAEAGVVYMAWHIRGLWERKGLGLMHVVKQRWCFCSESSAAVSGSSAGYSPSFWAPPVAESSLLILQQDFETVVIGSCDSRSDAESNTKLLGRV